MRTILLVVVLLAGCSKAPPSTNYILKDGPEMQAIKTTITELAGQNAKLAQQVDNLQEFQKQTLEMFKAYNSMLKDLNDR